MFNLALWRHNNRNETFIRVNVSYTPVSPLHEISIYKMIFSKFHYFLYQFNNIQEQEQLLLCYYQIILFALRNTDETEN